jgi:hypothetical protein
MSSTSSLFIGYARSTCDRAQVQTVLAPLVGLMDRIDETTRKDSKGYDYKMFFIHFAVSNPDLEKVVARIQREDFINIVYDTQWDKRKWNDNTQSYGAQVPRFWKVTLYVKKEKHVATPVSMPHIMSAEEVALIRTPKQDCPQGNESSRRRKHAD